MNEIPLPSSPKEQYLYNLNTSIFNYFSTETWNGEYWIDGKKIYNRGFSGITGTALGQDTLVSNDIYVNSTNVVEISFVVYNNSNSKYYANATQLINFYLNTTDFKFYYNITSAVTNCPFNTIIKYTK